MENGIARTDPGKDTLVGGAGRNRIVYGPGRDQEVVIDQMGIL